MKQLMQLSLILLGMLFISMFSFEPKKEKKELSYPSGIDFTGLKDSVNKYPYGKGISKGKGSMLWGY